MRAGSRMPSLCGDGPESTIDTSDNRGEFSRTDLEIIERIGHHASPVLRASVNMPSRVKYGLSL